MRNILLLALAAALLLASSPASAHDTLEAPFPFETLSGTIDLTTCGTTYCSAVIWLEIMGCYGSHRPSFSPPPRPSVHNRTDGGFNPANTFFIHGIQIAPQQVPGAMLSFGASVPTWQWALNGIQGSQDVIVPFMVYGDPAASHAYSDLPDGQAVWPQYVPVDTAVMPPPPGTPNGTQYYLLTVPVTVFMTYASGASFDQTFSVHVWGHCGHVRIIAVPPSQGDMSGTPPGQGAPPPTPPPTPPGTSSPDLEVVGGQVQPTVAQPSGLAGSALLGLGVSLAAMLAFRKRLG